MPLDTFICGSCLLSFNDIDDFIVHKRGCVQPPAQELQDGGVIVAGTQLPEGVTETEALSAVNTISNIECMYIENSWKYLSQSIN